MLATVVPSCSVRLWRIETIVPPMSVCISAHLYCGTDRDNSAYYGPRDSWIFQSGGVFFFWTMHGSLLAMKNGKRQQVRPLTPVKLDRASVCAHRIVYGSWTFSNLLRISFNISTIAVCIFATLHRSQLASAHSEDADKGHFAHTRFCLFCNRSQKNSWRWT